MNNGIPTRNNLPIDETGFNEGSGISILAEPNSIAAFRLYMNEKVKDLGNGIKICKSEYSHRFLLYKDEKPVSAIVVYLKDAKRNVENNVIVTAYTKQEERMKGYGNQLLSVVKEKFKKNLVVSETLTKEGQALFKPYVVELKKSRKPKV